MTIVTLGRALRTNKDSALQLVAFTKEETQILKGVGIILIVLHNFFNNLTPTIGVNEFVFRLQHVINFHSALSNNPYDLFRALFSYFGHYGVQIFIFFSAYGLTKKYHKKAINYWVFLRNRINKIYFPFLFCMVVYTFLGCLKSIFLTNETVLYWDSLLWKVLLISNFIPHQALMPVGPWWFIPFIFQFYIIFPFFFSGLHAFGAKFLLLTAFIGVMLQWFIHPYLIDTGLSLYYTVFGHLPLLCAGMYFASRKAVRIRTEYLWILLLLFVVGNFNAHVWAFSGFCFAVLVLVFSKWVLNHHRSPSVALASFSFFGGISLHLFMVNGFLRSPFHWFAEEHNVWWVDILSALVSLAFSTVFALLLKSLESKVRSTHWPRLNRTYNSR